MIEFGATGNTPRWLMRLIPARWYRSAAGGWFIAIRTRSGWHGFHVKRA